MKYRQALLVSFGGGALLTLGVVGLAYKAMADGIPSVDPLYYSGTLLEAGQPVTGPRSLSVALYTTATAGTPVCQTTPPPSVSVSGGRFRIVLPGACKAQINANPNLYVEVSDGDVVLPRTKIGAVPYAVEADHASGATYAADAGHAASADMATLANGLSPDAPIAPVTTGMISAKASTTLPVKFTSGGTYLLTALLWGTNIDAHQTYVINVPVGDNLDVDFAPLLSSSFGAGRIGLAPLDSAGAVGYKLSSTAFFTLELTFTASMDSGATWSYATARIM